MDGKLGKLLVHELDKYLLQHKLNKAGKKADKIAAITCHVMRSLPDIQDTSSDRSESESDDSESESEIVVAQVLSDSDSDSEDTQTSMDTEGDMEVESVGSSCSETEEYQFTQTRSGRRAGSWKNVFAWKP